MGPGGDDWSLAEPAAFEDFYRSHVDALLRYFYRRTADPEIAADLVSETFAAALRSAGGYSPQKGNTSQWLYGIARRQLAAFWKKQIADNEARERLHIPAEAIDLRTADALRQTESIIDSAEATAALEALPELLREAVTLRIIDELDYDEIALRLGCERGTARVRVFRGLERLQEVLR